MTSTDNTVIYSQTVDVFPWFNECFISLDDTTNILRCIHSRNFNFSFFFFC